MITEARFEEFAEFLLCRFGWNPIDFQFRQRTKKSINFSELPADRCINPLRKRFDECYLPTFFIISSDYCIKNYRQYHHPRPILLEPLLKNTQISPCEKDGVPSLSKHTTEPAYTYVHYVPM